MRSERDHRAVQSSQKVPVIFHSADPVVVKYMKLLTPYAFKYLSQQLDFKGKVLLKTTNLSLVANDPDQIFEVSSSKGDTLEVSLNSCQCSSWTSMKLPCRHILAVRDKVKVDLYSEDLCDRRWHISYYKLCQHAYTGDLNDDSPEFTSSVSSVSVSSKKTKKKVLFQFEKFHLVSKITTKLASLASEESGDLFNDRCEVLKYIIAEWENGRSVRFGKNVVGSPNVPKLDDNDLSDLELSDEEQVPRLGDNNVLQYEGHNSVQKHEDISVRPREYDSVHQHEDNYDNDFCIKLTHSEQTTPEIVQTCTTEQPLSQELFTSDLISPKDNTSQFHLNKDLAFKDKDKLPSTAPAVISVSAIKMPPILKKKGRPKGHDLTVVGLPKRKICKKKVLPFILLHVSMKEKVMLRWFVDEEIVQKTLNDSKFLIDETDVEVRPEKLSDALMDENVDVHLIRKFFTEDAWLVVNQAYERKKQSDQYTCKICFKDIYVAESVVCEHCLEWHHLHCVGLSKAPKRKYWFCKNCCTNV